MSGKKNPIRQQGKLKNSLRLTMIAAATAIAGLIVVLIVIFNLTQDEVGHAMSSMTFKSAEVFQDTTSVLRGSINQKIIGITVAEL